MKGLVGTLIPDRIIIEKEDIRDLFFRWCRQETYRTPPSMLKELVNDIADFLDEDGYPLSIEINEIKVES